MPIRQVFSKRESESCRTGIDVYRYDVFPETLASQVGSIFGDVAKKLDFQLVEQICDRALRDLCREHGRKVRPLSRPSFLSRDYSRDTAFDRYVEYFESEKRSLERLDYIEVFFQDVEASKGEANRKMKKVARSRYAEPDFEQERSELNQRFLQHSLGYQLEGLRLVRLDSGFLHAQAVRPILEILDTNDYSGAQAEFLLAHEHYRHRRFEDALVNCGKAFESTMKAICAKRGWSYDQDRSTAKELISILESKDFFPRFWQSTMGSLRVLLESAIPAPRNKRGGHGAGASVRVVPEEMVTYVMHLTASTLLYLAQVERSNSVQQ